MPGGTIGILGGGQLGRMFAMAARRMGYRVALCSTVTGLGIDRIRAELHGKVTAFGEHAGLDTDKKDFGFTVAGRSLLVDDVRVWEATAKKGFDKQKFVARD